VDDSENQLQKKLNRIARNTTVIGRPYTAQGAGLNPDVSRGELSAICSVCRELDPQNFGPKSQTAIPIKYLQAADSCWGCDILRRVINWVGQRNKVINRLRDRSLHQILPEVKFEELGIDINYDGYGGLCLEFCSLSSEPIVKNQIMIYAEGLPWHDFLLGKESCLRVPWDFWIDVSLAWAKEKLEKCKSSHSRCQVRERALPTRLLDLGQPEETDFQGSIRLVENCEQQAEYACLSHCWGTSQKLTTTRANLDDHKERIDLARLPKTFQDAVIVSRKLGIRYLWIDSLCIIQNDEDDWSREASKMAQVYQNSSLCIAASSVSDDAGGLQDSFQPLGNLGPVQRGALARNVFVYRSVHEFNGMYYDPYGSVSGPFSRLPLLRRGWVFQEHLLAPRFLHFAGHRGVFLECMETTVSEDGFEDHILSRKISHARSLSTDSQYQLQRQWRLQVGHFSGLKLTKEDDVLPAIARLAKQLERYRKCQYFAGLWEDSFVVDLMWTARNWGVFQRPKPGKWRAPSWSWASVNDGTSYIKLWIAEEFIGRKAGLQCECDVVEVRCVPVLDDAMGKLASGWVKLSGIVSSVSLARKSSIDYSLIRLSQYSLAGQVFPDPCVFPEGTEGATEEAFYLHLGTIITNYMGLALRQSEDLSFERIGLIKLSRASTDPVIGSIQALGSARTITIR
jgi:hypothetical protein